MEADPGNAPGLRDYEPRVSLTGLQFGCLEMVTVAGLAPAYSYLQNRCLDYFDLTMSTFVEIGGDTR